MNKTTIEINFPKFYAAQLAVFSEVSEGNAKYITVNGSRQVGKSLLLIFSALLFSMQASSQLVMIVSPTDNQAQSLFTRTMESTSPVPGFVKSSKHSGGQAEIQLNNNSRILFRSAKSEDGLRGFSLTHICIDEHAFIKEETWTKILAPSLTVRGRKSLFVSTPKGNNFFKKMYDRGIEEAENLEAKDRRYASFKITYVDNPYADLDFIEEQRIALPIEVFRQEYLGEFIDAASVFKNTLDLATRRSQIPDGQECVAGIDIGMVKDFTVVVIMSPEGEMLDMLRFNKLEMHEAVNEIEAFLRKWQPRKILLELNNQGRPFYDMLKRRELYGLEGFNTTATSKPLLLHELIAAMNKRELRLLGDHNVINEFQNFTYTVTTTGQLRFAASHGHDDIVMATAFAHRARNMYQLSQLYIY